MFLEYKLEPEYFFPLFADNLFSGLAAESLASLDEIKQTKQFQKGENFFSVGDTTRCVYVLREGKAHLLLNGEKKETSIARSIERNEIIGLTESIAGLSCETNAESCTACLCECFAREDFIRFLHDEPEVCFRLVQTLGLNLQKSYKIFCSSISQKM